MSADIIFVNLPPYESYYSDRVPHLGMLYVLTSLRAHGYTVGYLDCADRGSRLRNIIEKIKEAAPKMVGFSIDSDNLFSAGKMSRLLKTTFGDELKIIFGGPASQGQAEEIMLRSAADVLVIGEGEFAAREVADCLLRGVGSLDDIDGVCYRDGDRLVRTAPRAPIDDLDALPFPDYDFLDRPLDYKPSIISGRGCPFKCTFCFEGRMGNRYRHRSPENIVAEIRKIVDMYGPVYLTINDDTFTSDPAHAMEVCRLLEKNFRPREDLMWFCEVRVDIVRKHPELVDAMVAAGAGRIQIGMESADDGMLRAYKRMNVKPTVVEEVVGRFYRAGLPSVYCGFIVGGPGETMQSLETSLAFAKHMINDVAPGAFECFPSYLTPLPGTEIREHPERLDIRLLDPDLLTSSNFNFPTTETSSLCRAEINNFRWRFIEETSAAMISVIRRMPWSTIALHAKLNRRFNLTTGYFERFAKFPRLKEYLDMVGEHGWERADEIDERELMGRHPTRLTASLRMEEGRIQVGGGPTTFELSNVGARIYSLCSGKLSTREIVDEVAREMNGGGPPRDELAADVAAFVRELDSNYAVFLKDF